MFRKRVYSRSAWLEHLVSTGLQRQFVCALLCLPMSVGALLPMTTAVPWLYWRLLIESSWAPSACGCEVELHITVD